MTSPAPSMPDHSGETAESDEESPADQTTPFLPFERIVLPLGSETDHDRVLLPATVLSSWFDAPIQIVCDNEADLAGHQALAASLGRPIEPVVLLESAEQAESDGPGQPDSQSGQESTERTDPAPDPVVGFAHSHAPALIIVDSSPQGLSLAATSTQPVFIVADELGHRMPVGPLAAEVTGQPEDLDALALTSVLARALGETVRLVVGTDGASGSASDVVADWLVDAEARLRQMGCEVGVDALRAHGLHPIVLVGRTRGSTAIVLPQSRLDEPGLVERATAQGVNVFVAPSHDDEVGRAAPFDVNLTRTPDPPPSGAALDVLDRAECLARLERHTVARIGYVDGGWPVVVPVNYRVYNGDIFIRSLAGGKLRAAERHDTVCLEIDGYDEQLRTGWSVTAHGELEVISDAATLRQAWANDPQPWVAADGWQWLRMVPFAVDGREVWPEAAG